MCFAVYYEQVKCVIENDLIGDCGDQCNGMRNLYVVELD